MGLRLTIRDHTDCIILMNAVREHCRKTADEYHTGFLRALASNDEKQANDCLRWRNETQQCAIRTLARLEKMRQRFEDMMPEPESETTGSGYGYSIDNATCYN